MSEIPKPKSPEELLKEEGEAQLAAWLKDHPETVITAEARRESGPEVAEFEALIAAFEAKHSLAELHAIIDLTPQEAPQHPVREPARADLVPIVAKLKVLEKETDIPSEKLGEMKAHYKRLSRAVGMINSNKVDHTR